MLPSNFLKNEKEKQKQAKEAEKARKAAEAAAIAELRAEGWEPAQGGGRGKGRGRGGVKAPKPEGGDDAAPSLKRGRVKEEPKGSHAQLPDPKRRYERLVVAERLAIGHELTSC